MKQIFIFSIGLIFILSACSGNRTAEERTPDHEVLERYFEFMRQNADAGASVSELFTQTALFFLETPYVAHTLEINEEEQLVVNLRGLDCVTIVESSIALVRAWQSGNHTMEQFKNELQFVRYRDGIIDGYPSRLHYFSDWIVSNERKGILTDITREIGGVPIQFDLNIMSSRFDLYPALRYRPDFVERIREVEEYISARTFYFIPEDQIDAKRDFIRNGDIICFVTSRTGLDISHVGIAYWYGDKPTFIHASLTAMTVLIEPRTIAEYVASISHNIGIIVLRLN